MLCFVLEEPSASKPQGTTGRPSYRQMGMGKLEADSKPHPSFIDICWQNSW